MKLDLIIGNILLLSALLLSGCDVAEPERIINNYAYPPSVGTVLLNPLKPETYLDGEIVYQLDVSKVSFKVSSYDIYLNEYFCGSSNKAPWIIQHNINGLPEGKFKLIVNIYQDNKPHGLLNIADPPSLILTGDVIIDHTPPKPVTLSPVESDNSGRSAVLHWTKTLSKNFYAYVVYRNTDNYINWNAIDTLYNLSDTTLIDTNIPELYGRECQYSVKVFTGSSFSRSAMSNTQNFIHGSAIQLPYDAFGYLGALINPVLPEVYYLGHYQLFAVSANDYKILRSYPVKYGQYIISHCSFNISDDGTEIYLFNPVDSILQVLNVQSLSLKRSINLPCRMKDAIIPSKKGEILMISLNSVIYSIDISSGTYKIKVPSGDTGELCYAAISSDKSRLFCSSMYNYNKNDYRILEYDLISSSNNPIATGYATALMKILLSRDNRTLFEWNSILQNTFNPIYIRNTGSFSVTSQFSPSGTYKYVAAVCVTNSKIYISASERNYQDYTYAAPPGKIIELDKDSFAELRSWNTAITFTQLAVSNDESKLFLENVLLPYYHCLIKLK